MWIYGAMDFVLINAIKEQQAIIDSLKQNQKTVDSLLNAQRSKDSILTITLNNLMNSINNCCSKGGVDIRMYQNNTEDNTINIALSPKSEMILFQNHPNPFNNNTTIRYYISENIISENFYIIFQDVHGQEIERVLITPNGFGSVNIDTQTLSSGIYSYSLIVNDKVIDTKKMVKN